MTTWWLPQIPQHESVRCVRLKSLKSVMFIPQALSIGGVGVLYFLYTISAKTLPPMTPNNSSQHDRNATMLSNKVLKKVRMTGMGLEGKSYLIPLLRGKVLCPAQKNPPNNGALTWLTKSCGIFHRIKARPFHLRI